MNKIEYGEIATVVGRYYAMDRDKRWERLKIAFDGLYKGVGELIDTPEDIYPVRKTSLNCFISHPVVLRVFVDHTGARGNAIKTFSS